MARQLIREQEERNAQKYRDGGAVENILEETFSSFQYVKYLTIKKDRKRQF